MFKVILGDIKNQKGDYIVNPSNTILKLGSGVSGVLRIMCPELQDVMKEYLNRNGYLNPGDIAITPYPCEGFKWVIHAAVMDYKRGAIQVNPDYERIEKICKNISEFLDEKKVKVITPLLGTGVGGLDKKKVFNIMKKYFFPLKADVILVVHKKNDFDLIQD